MKKFGRKLVLSGLALAATAATLSTSTYAWYVSNDTADVKGGTAGTAGDTISGNLLVAQNDVATGLSDGDYKNNINIGSTYTFSGDLDPVKYKDSKWYDKNGAEIEIDEEDASTVPYQEVSFWVLSTEAESLTVAITAKNTTTAAKPQVCLNENGAPTGAQLNKTFFVDAGEALKFEVTKQEYKAATEGGELTLGEASAVGIYDMTGFAQGGYTGLSGALPGGDSNAYYENLLGDEPAGGATGSGVATSGEFDALTVAKNVETKITIRIWLDGTDAQCFDSCIGQDFTFDIQLKATEGQQG